MKVKQVVVRGQEYRVGMSCRVQGTGYTDFDSSLRITERHKRKRGKEIEIEEIHDCTDDDRRKEDYIIVGSQTAWHPRDLEPVGTFAKANAELRPLR